MSQEDILLWPDSFWCFRNEQHQQPLRDDKYRVIPLYSAEWVSYAAPPPQEDFVKR